MKFKIERGVPNTRLDVENYIAIVEALEKQIPAEITREDLEQSFKCPTCGEDRYWKDGAYCKDCGQKLEGGIE